MHSFLPNSTDSLQNETFKRAVLILSYCCSVFTIVKDFLEHSIKVILNLIRFSFFKSAFLLCKYNHTSFLYTYIYTDFFFTCFLFHFLPFNKNSSHTICCCVIINNYISPRDKRKLQRNIAFFYFLQFSSQSRFYAYTHQQ